MTTAEEGRRAGSGRLGEGSPAGTSPRQLRSPEPPDGGPPRQSGPALGPGGGVVSLELFYGTCSEGKRREIGYGQTVSEKNNFFY